MTTAEIIIAVFGGMAALLGGMAWIGNYLIKRVESKRDLDLKKLDKDIEESEKAKKILVQQKETIRAQNDKIMTLSHQINEMELKLRIILPLVKKALKDDPDIAEILDHLEKFSSGNTTPANG